MKSNMKRLFINNLQSKISENDILEKFNNYGSVQLVDIKSRKNPVGSQAPNFAYINITIEDHALHKCITDLTNNAWKGQFINVQVAKESFIDRLKREREENEEKGNNIISNGTPCLANAAVECDNVVDNFKVHKKTIATNINQNEPKVGLEKKEVVSHNKDNEKRLKSLMHMKESYQQQKLQIKNALSNIDKTNTVNKIIFNDDPQDNSIMQGDFNGMEHKNKPKMQLFDENDETEVYFKEQHQFDGVVGQKLLKLQSRFQNDDRFKMDSRFLEEDEEDNVQTFNMEEPTINEKEQQMKILESVLGKKLKRPLASREGSDHKKPKVMLRFDPTLPEHCKFELPKENVVVVKDKKKEKRQPIKIVQQPLPEVSKDTFYKVSGDLKNTLHEKEGFSLAELFSSRIENDKSVAEEESIESKELNKKFHYDQKTFKYDSSDEEGENLGKAQFAKEEKTNEHNATLQMRPRMWTETFFFKNDDYRLQEGYDFIKRLQLGEQEDFKNTRRNLREIVKSKVRNNLRKNEPFKRKLGGNKKRINIKRALKR
ncbi:hypothetical protein FQA39_LY04673 [Lamprigera yunnana]|nr:hypothetical protein FQA39_LY04673 [Lamprigera yunnana]